MTAPVMTAQAVMKDGIWTSPAPAPGTPGGGGTDPSSTGVSIEDYTFYCAGPTEDPQGNVPSARTAFLPWTEQIVPMVGALSARALTYMGSTAPGAGPSADTPPAGSRLAFEYHDGSTWQPFAEGGGDCFVALDGGEDVGLAGAWVTPAAAAVALGDVRVRMVRFAGDDASNLFHGECHLQIQYGAQATTPPANPCDAIISGDFGAYADWAAAEADGYSLTDAGGVVTGITIDADHVLTGTKSLHLTVTGDGGDHLVTVQKDYTVPAPGNYGVTLAGYFTGDVSVGTPADTWLTQTVTAAVAATTLHVEPVRLNITGSGTLDVWAAGPIVAPECAGGPPPTDPPDPPEAFGGAFGLYNGPGMPDHVAPFNTYLLNITPGNYASKLNQARALNHKVFIQPSLTRENWINGNGTFNEAMYNDIVDSWSGIDLSPWSDIILGNHVIDEPYCAPCFGGTAIPWEAVNRIAGRWKALPGWSWMLTYIRVDAVRMEGNDLSNVNGCWNQYLARLGQVNAYVSSQRTSAQRQGKRWVWGMNIKDGGNGTSGIPGTTGNDADSGRIRWEMTADEVLIYGLTLAASGGDALMCWRYDAPLLGRAGMQAALAQVAAKVAELAA